MRPGGTPEQPTIVIEGQDVELLRFGISGGPAVIAPNRTEILTALKDKQDVEGRPDYWRGVVEIEATPENIAICGLGLRNVLEDSDRINRPNPIPGSISDAERKATLAIVEAGRQALIQLAGGETELAMIMSSQNELWDKRTERFSRR